MRYSIAFFLLIIGIAACSSTGSKAKKGRYSRNLISAEDIKSHSTSTAYEIIQRLRLYLFRHQSIHLYISIDSIEFPVPELAEVELVAGMAGRGIPDGSDWPLEADLYEFNIQLELDDDE